MLISKPLAVALLVALGSPAWAGNDLAVEKQCMQCHKVDEDWAGPALHKIAVKYKARKGARETIAATVQQGTGGKRLPHWGKAKMPDMSERPEISKAEALMLADWVLAQ